MGASYITGPLIFLIETLSGLYLFALMLRFLLQWVEADFYNPISQFLVKITHPPLRFLRRLIPSLGPIDMASIVLMLALQTLASLLIALLQQVQVSPIALLAGSFGQLLELLYNILFFSIIIFAVLSWIAPRGYNPTISLLHSLSEPLLRAFRRLLPPVGGIDLSPLLALIALQFVYRVVQPLLQQYYQQLNSMVN
ncbi:MAG: YggT family protein [Methylococcaceae bacterium]|nr:YggT family protein [Methylococcaceae bacterium]